MNYTYTISASRELDNRPFIFNAHPNARVTIQPAFETIAGIKSVKQWSSEIELQILFPILTVLITNSSGLKRTETTNPNLEEEFFSKIRG